MEGVDLRQEPRQVADLTSTSGQDRARDVSRLRSQAVAETQPHAGHHDLTGVIARSVDWIDLKARMLRAGFMIRRGDKGVGVVSLSTGEFRNWPGTGQLSIASLRQKFGPGSSLGAHFPRWARH
ncbi:hypothetical protein [Cognatishimia maritima]|uniref:Uncharacterized protein n=1 Tax=Cognatishimia maritima TaxID=870908 RepID=A0A1M5NU08_9RHOB|nr:hypothetical protein [Cognatishimia maritima]SHG92669.1 hypothetical protein SAMN04488044_1623 [Cognatishimia maritima]